MSLKCKHSPHCLRLQPWLNQQKPKSKGEKERRGESLLKFKQDGRDFPGGPVAKTLPSQCRGPGIDPCLENQILHACSNLESACCKQVRMPQLKIPRATTKNMPQRISHMLQLRSGAAEISQTEKDKYHMLPFICGI